MGILDYQSDHIDCKRFLSLNEYDEVYYGVKADLF